MVVKSCLFGFLVFFCWCLFLFGFLFEFFWGGCIIYLITYTKLKVYVIHSFFLIKNGNLENIEKYLYFILNMNKTCYNRALCHKRSLFY